MKITGSSLPKCIRVFKIASIGIVMVIGSESKNYNFFIHAITPIL